MVKKSGIMHHKPSEGYWDIPEVVYRGEKGTYRVFEKMTPAMTQDELASFYEKEKQKGNPHPIDASLIYAIASKGYDLRDENPKEAEKFRNFFQESLKQYPNTLTRIIYNPQGEDEIIHNYGTPDKFSFSENVVGSDREINDSDKNVLEKILGIDNIKRINEISQWINNTNTYLWRFNSKPLQKNERVVGFDADPDWLGLSCSRYPANQYPAFRVLEVE